MNQSSILSSFRASSGIPLLLGLVLMTGCESRRSFRVIEISGEDESYSLSFYFGLGFTGAEEGGPTPMLVREGDLLMLPFVPILATDESPLDFESAGGLLMVEGEVVSLELDTPEGLDWLEKATPSEMAALRSIYIDSDLTPEAELLLGQLATHAPHLCLALDGEAELPGLLHLFDPEALYLFASIAAEHVKLLAREESLRALAISADGLPDLDFLAEIPNLETLFVFDWDQNQVGPLPDSIPSLRSVTLFETTLKDLSGLGSQIRLRELTLSSCDAAGDTKSVDISALASHPKLEGVFIYDCPVSGDLSPLDSLEELIWLGLPSGTTQQQLEHVVDTHPGLTILEILGAEEISDLTPLTELRKLRALLVGSSAPPDPLFGMDQLEYLAVEVEEDDSTSFGENDFARLRVELPGTAIARVAPFCLGSGFILLLIPMVGGAWWMARRRRRPGRPIHRHG